MQIIYISIGHVAQGVLKKLEDKTIMLSKAGVKTDLWLVGASVLPQPPVTFKAFSPELGLALRVARWPLLWRLYILLEQYAIYQAIKAQLDRQKGFDYIMLRYPIADLFLWRFIKRYPGKVIFEHNSLEQPELNLRRKAAFDFKYFYWNEKIFGQQVRAHAAGLIGVTDEITQYQRRISKTNIPNVTISNGINVQRVSVKKGDRFDGKHLNLLMLTGSGVPWHGVDILLKGLSLYRGSVKIHVIVAGQTIPEIKTLAESIDNVTLLPPQTGSNLDLLIDRCHLGIGSLGFGHSFLKEACTLKVREYWARGLPFVLGYDDIDLIDNKDMTPFFCRIDASRGLSMNEIVAFAYSVNKIENYSEEMRKLALRHIDYGHKVDKLVSFVKALQK